MEKKKYQHLNDTNERVQDEIYITCTDVTQLTVSISLYPISVIFAFQFIISIIWIEVTKLEIW